MVWWGYFPKEGFLVCYPRQPYPSIGVSYSQSTSKTSVPAFPGILLQVYLMKAQSPSSAGTSQVSVWIHSVHTQHPLGSYYLGRCQMSCDSVFSSSPLLKVCSREGGCKLGIYHSSLVRWWTHFVPLWKCNSPKPQLAQLSRGWNFLLPIIRRKGQRSKWHALRDRKHIQVNLYSTANVSMQTLAIWIWDYQNWARMLRMYEFGQVLKLSDLPCSLRPGPHS